MAAMAGPPGRRSPIPPPGAPARATARMRFASAAASVGCAAPMRVTIPSRSSRRPPPCAIASAAALACSTRSAASTTTAPVGMASSAAAAAASPDCRSLWRNCTPRRRCGSTRSSARRCVSSNAPRVSGRCRPTSTIPASPAGCMAPSRWNMPSGRAKSAWKTLRRKADSGTISGPRRLRACGASAAIPPPPAARRWPRDRAHRTRPRSAPSPAPECRASRAGRRRPSRHRGRAAPRCRRRSGAAGRRRPRARDARPPRRRRLPRSGRRSGRKASGGVWIPCEWRCRPCRPHPRGSGRRRAGSRDNEMDETLVFDPGISQGWRRTVNRHAFSTSCAGTHDQFW